MEKNKALKVIRQSLDGHPKNYGIEGTSEEKDEFAMRLYNLFKKMEKTDAQIIEGYDGAELTCFPNNLKIVSSIDSCGNYHEEITFG